MVSAGLHFRESGSGSPLILLHPVGLDGSFWSGIAEPLSSHHRVIAVDIAGHGASPAAARPGRMADRVKELIQLITEQGGSPATLLGVSFGGMIAQQVALARPDLVAGLVLAGCPGRIPPEARPAILKRGSDAEAGGMEAVLASTIERWFSSDFLSTEEVARVRRRLIANKPSNWAAAWEAIAEHDVLARLGAFDGPTLVIAGENDLATPLDAKRALAAALPRSRLVVLKGAPHMMQIEQPGPFLGAVQTFLEERSALP